MTLLVFLSFLFRFVLDLVCPFPLSSASIQCLSLYSMPAREGEGSKQMHRLFAVMVAFLGISRLHLATDMSNKALYKTVLSFHLLEAIYFIQAHFKLSIDSKPKQGQSCISLSPSFSECAAKMGIYGVMPLVLW